MIAVLKSAGGSVLVLLLLVSVLIIAGLLIVGVTFLTAYLVPWALLTSSIAFGLTILVLLPLSVFRGSRLYAGLTIYCFSYLFGTTAWMLSLITVGQLWGGWAIFLGLLMGGVGVVPMAMIAVLFHGAWITLLKLIGLTALSFAGQLYATSIVKAHERAKEQLAASPEAGSFS